MKWLLILPFALAASPGLADYNLNGKTIDCYCTDSSGGRVELGETICLQVDGKMFMAQCQMSLNVPMWRKIRDGCLSSQVFTPQNGQPGLQSLPVDARVTAAKS
ncbi:hypothetical protein [Marimonas arenosa]|uniref:Uncharacterized protein n=1 Tax=Marimonas arenosa TaxID=1795305 RepID=A0AAE3WGL9_9RHOB|nr:hypothetical protein [Marimonas arenosa]MDQ2091273.1 hypothetical protein [Marimonas arenosa]